MPRGILVLVYVLAVLLVGSVALTAHLFNIPIGNLTRDLSAVANVNPFTGYLSNLGILLWCASGAISLFAACALHSRNSLGRSKFLLFFGMFSLVLMIDDFFSLHELIFPEYFGIRQRYVLLAYIIIMVFISFEFRNFIIESYYYPLVMALFFFFISMGVDASGMIAKPWRYVAEDGSKFVGIVSWTTYFVHYSYFSLLYDGEKNSLEALPSFGR